MLAKIISDMMIRPGNSPVFNSPGDEGLDYKDIEFKTEDGVLLRGWLIPGKMNKVIIQTHFGVQCCRSGYTPKGKGMIKLWRNDISFLRQAKYLNKLGYGILMYDMRNHGDSDAGRIPWVTWGPEEANDVIAAVKHVTEHPELDNPNIGLLSICMGAVASTYAYGMGDNGLKGFDNVKAMIAVQPLHYNEFVKALGIPAFLNKAGCRLSFQRTGIDLQERTFMPDVKEVSVPTLVLQNRNDPWTDLDLVERYYSDLTVDKELQWVDLEKSRGAAYDYLGSSPEFIHDFFGRYMD